MQTAELVGAQAGRDDGQWPEVGIPQRQRHAAEADPAHRLDEDREPRLERRGPLDVGERLVQDEQMIALALELVQRVGSAGEGTFRQRRGTKR
jgi:hypothetical protein